MSKAKSEPYGARGFVGARFFGVTIDEVFIGAWWRVR